MIPPLPPFLFMLFPAQAQIEFRRVSFIFVLIFFLLNFFKFYSQHCKVCKLDLQGEQLFEAILISKSFFSKSEKIYEAV